MTNQLLRLLALATFCHNVACPPAAHATARRKSNEPRPGDANLLHIHKNAALLQATLQTLAAQALLHGP